jgi:hypothetical protein
MKWYKLCHFDRLNASHFEEAIATEQFDKLTGVYSEPAEGFEMTRPNLIVNYYRNSQIKCTFFY